MEKIQVKFTKKHLIIVSVVLMVALVVGMGAMTYSKYISSYTSGSQTATAAKWGFVVTAETTNLFPTDYTLGDGATHATKADNGVAVNASSATLAPGTTGYVSIAVNGTAEVKAVLTVALNVTSQVGYNNTYLPIKWALTQSPTTPTEWKSYAEVDADVRSLSAEIDAGESVTGSYYIHWCWDFETGANADEKAANNRHDTIIGAKSAYGNNVTEVNKVIGEAITAEELGKYNNVLTFSLTATIEQVQK